MAYVIGTAGWSIPKDQAQAFPPEGSALERYAARFGGVEINSSFHRPHRPATWARWAASVPERFRFSVKLPKVITHQLRLVDSAAELVAHLAAASELGPKLAIHLVQLPPSLAFDAAMADRFFATLAELAGLARIACEPRHASWFEPAAEEMLATRRVARVTADPARVPAAAHPGGWRGLAYYRLHGSPIVYRSRYDDARLSDYRCAMLEGPGAETWCVFDNTASSAATGNALTLGEMLAEN